MLHWYALRIFNNRRYQDIVADIGPDEYYVPLDLYARRDDGRRAIRLTQRPIESLLFIRVTARRADELRRQRPRPYMLYESADTDGTLRPHPIPENEMTIFRIVTSAGDPDLRLIDTAGLPWPDAAGRTDVAAAHDGADRPGSRQSSPQPCTAGATAGATATAPLRPGTRVRVTAGPLAGAEGIIRRVAHQRRLQITITGVCTLLTGYIPAPLLQPIE